MQREQVEQALRRLGMNPQSFTGQWVQCSCPFAADRHDRGTDRSASFGVMVGTRSFYNCFTCKSKGRFIDLPRELGMDNWDELASELIRAEATGLQVEAHAIEVEEDIPPIPEEIYGDLFPVVDDGPALEYLLDRGIDQQTAEDMGLGDWPEERRIMFPVRGFDGALYGWTGRDYGGETKVKVWNTKGLDKSCHLLGAEHCSLELPIIVVEGLFMLAYMVQLIHEQELPYDVVACMGSNLSFEQASLLTETGQDIYMFLDNDKAGKLGLWGDPKKETDGAMQLLAKVRPPRYVTYPQMTRAQLDAAGRKMAHAVEDPDDLTEEQIIDMLESATVYARKRKRVRS